MKFLLWLDLSLENGLAVKNDMTCQAKHVPRVFYVKIRKYLLGAAGAHFLEFCGLLAYNVR